MPSCCKRLQPIVNLSQTRTDLDNIREYSLIFDNICQHWSGNKELKQKKTTEEIFEGQRFAILAMF